MSTMSFRVALLRVSDQLTNQQLDHLKFLSRSVLTNSRIDRIRASLDLFAALEERGKLSCDNTSFLHRMLESAGYNEARSELANFPPHVPAEVDETFLFYECLLKIATGLESTQFDNVKFFFKDRLKQNVQKIYSAIELFQLLIQRQIIRATDLRALQDALYQVGCVSLCNRVVNEYMQKATNGYQQQHGGPAAPNTLYTGNPQQFARPIEETPLNNKAPPFGPPMERFSSTSSLSPLSPSDRMGSGASTMSSIEGNTSLTERRINSMTSQPSMDSSQHPAPVIDNHGRTFGTPRPQFKQENPTPEYSAQDTNTPYGGMHPQSQISDAHYGQHPVSQQSCASQHFESQQPPNVPFRAQHPESQPSQNHYSESQPPHPQYRPPDSQQYYGGHASENRSPHVSFGGQHPISQPSYPLQSPSPVPQFQIGGGDRFQYPQQHQLPIIASVFEMEEEKQQQLSQNQQLQKELARKETELRLREDNIRAYQAQLANIQDRMSSVSNQHEGREREYQEKISDLEAVLKQMTAEAGVQISEMQRLHQQLQVANPRSSQDDEDYYKMGQSPHGICLIINNYEFYHADPEKQHPTRNGANVDVHNLTQTFKYLRYKVETKENLSSVEMKETLLRMANRDHGQYDSFICCILTHGEQGVVHGSDCEAVNLNDLAGVMKICPSLCGKPKLFFIQACRGDRETKGFELPERDSGGPYHNTIPQESDFYFGFATPTGSSAYRSRRYGSWFISEVCQVFIKHSYTHDLGAMMVKVNKRVSDAYTKDGYKQSPESVNRLRFQVHFFRFIKGINVGH